MIRSLYLLFSLALLFVATAADSLSGDELAGDEKAGNKGWGTIRGVVKVTGEIPPRRKIELDPKSALCGKLDLHDDSLLISPDRGLQNVVFMLYRSRSVRQDPPIHPELISKRTDPSELKVGTCQFEPHLIKLRTGESIRVNNTDLFGHAPRFLGINNLIDSPAVPPQSDWITKIEKAESVPIRIQCSAHAWMSAFLLVRDEPYVAITDESGSFSLENFPVGEWEFVFWHELGGKDRTGGFLVDLNRDSRPFVDSRGRFKIKVEAEKVTDLGEIQVPIATLSTLK